MRIFWGHSDTSKYLFADNWSGPMMNLRMNCIALSLALTLLTRSPLLMVVLWTEGHPWRPCRCQGIEPKGFCQSRKLLFYYTSDGHV